MVRWVGLGCGVAEARRLAGKRLDDWLVEDEFLNDELFLDDELFVGGKGAALGNAASELLVGWASDFAKGWPKRPDWPKRSGALTAGALKPRLADPCADLVALPKAFLAWLVRLPSERFAELTAAVALFWTVAGDWARFPSSCLASAPDLRMSDPVLAAFCCNADGAAKRLLAGGWVGAFLSSPKPPWLVMSGLPGALQ